MADKGFSKKLKDLRLKAGYSQKEVYEHFGIPQSTFSSWEVGKSEPPGDMLIKLCKFYNCDMIKDLSTDESDNVTYTEWKMIEKYRFISTHSPDGAVVVDTVLDREYAIAEKLREQKEQLEKARKMDMEVSEEIVPLRLWAYYGKIACAGTGFIFDDIPTDTIEAPDANADFIIGVNGDSMEPDYSDGEKLYIKKVERINPGEVGIFTINNECFLKEYGEDGLVSKNKKYDDIPGNEDVRLIGRVVGKVEE